MARTSSLWQPQSIRFRLTAWYALTLAVGLGLFALAIWFLMWRSLMQDADGMLLDRVASVEAFLNAELKIPQVQLTEELGEYAQAFPPNSYMLIQKPGGLPLFRSPAKFPWPVQTDGRRRRMRWGGHAYRLMTKPIWVLGQPWTVSLAAPLDAAEQLLQRLRLLLLGLVPLVIAISSFGGNWLSRRALKPVANITAAAGQIGIENLSQRLLVPQTGDELQNLSETWNSMLARLEGAVRRLTSFTADASHELRTPLAVIRSTAEIAVRKARPAESYRESLRQIAAESESMTQMVEDLLFLARGDAGTIEAPRTRIELASLIADACSQMAGISESKGLRLRFTPPGNPVHIIANYQAIRRLVLILVDNAVKYSGPGGDVTLELRGEPGEVRLAIHDNGPGIPDSELPLIFERFYRSPLARQAGQGTGLGLSLAAGIAQYHGATINVSSISGEGSIFTVIFPAIGPRSETIPVESPAEDADLPLSPSEPAPNRP
jgi:two-component system, OmpR family, heavy metal sensor histidine kinase CusS